MNPIKLNLHSVVDIITNSSTEIFISAHSDGIDKLKQLINKILLCAGSTKTADDIFDFEKDYGYAKSYYDEYIDDCEDNGKDSKSFITWYEEDFGEGEFKISNSIILKPKDTSKESMDFVGEFQKIFGIYEGNNY